MTGAFRVSPNFTIGELAVSRTHPQLVEPVPDQFGDRAVRLITQVLQPVRDEDGRTTINSGYRSELLNRALGGSSTSQHLRAEAADIVTTNVLQTFEGLMTGRIKVSPAHLGQAIYYPAQGFLHLALPSARYPRPSFHLHWPQRGHEYLQLRDVAQLRTLLR